MNSVYKPSRLTALVCPKAVILLPLVGAVAAGAIVGALHNRLVRHRAKKARS